MVQHLLGVAEFGRDLGPVLVMGLEPDRPFARVLAGQQHGQPGGPNVGGSSRRTATFASEDGNVSEANVAVSVPQGPAVSGFEVRRTVGCLATFRRWGYGVPFGCLFRRPIQPVRTSSLDRCVAKCHEIRARCGVVHTGGFTDAAAASHRVRHLYRLTGVSVSVRNVFDPDRIAFRLNDPDGVLPLPFPVFARWTEFRRTHGRNRFSAGLTCVRCSAGCSSGAASWPKSWSTPRPGEPMAEPAAMPELALAGVDPRY